MLQRRQTGLLQKKKVPGLVEGMGMGTSYSGEQFPSPSFVLPLADAGAGAVNLIAKGAGSTTPTFTRATTATTIGPTGLVTAVATGVARSYYDPTTLEYRGYLAEGARTNLCLQSEDFSSGSWAKTDTTITANAIVAPDGNTTADLLTEGVAGTAGISAASMNITADVSHTATIWVKRGNADWLFFRMGATGASCDNWFNLNTGALGSSAAGGTATAISKSIQAFPNGWYRLSITCNMGGGQTSAFLSFFNTTASGGSTRVNNATRYQWGAQFENNVAFASTYIPTTTVAVTRNADVLTYASSGNYSSSLGSVYAELSLITAATGSFRVAVVNDVAELLSVTISAATTGIQTFDTAPTVVTKTGLTDMATGSRKRVASWGTGQSITGDGATVATGVFSGNKGAAVSGIAIGAYQAGTNSWFGTIRNVRIWTTQLPDVKLQILTR